MTNLVPAIGASCLGAVVGWLVRYFIRRFEKFGPGVLSSVITIMLGGAAVKFLAADPTVLWFYPIGLFVGFVIYQIIVMVYAPSRESGGAFTGTVDMKGFLDKHDPRYVNGKGGIGPDVQ
jgi:hypothetical protein